MAYDSLIKWVIPGLVFRYFRLIKSSFEKTNVPENFQVTAFYFISKPFQQAESPMPIIWLFNN